MSEAGANSSDANHAAQSRRRVHPIIIPLCFAIALALAASLDSSVAAGVRVSGLESFMHSHAWLRAALKAPGIFWFTIPIAIAILLFHPAGWRGSLLLILGNAMIALNDMLKWIVGRTRPYKLHENILEPFVLQPFRNGIKGMFDTKNLSFASGHASLAFATAAALGILLPRWRWIFYAMGMIVAAERVAENAHWLSDIVAGAVVGFGSVWIITRVWWNKNSDGSNTLPVAGDTGLQRAGEHSGANGSHGGGAGAAG